MNLIQIFTPRIGVNFFSIMDSQSSGFKRRKKHMSNYQRAMKYSKRGKFGHGFQIQEEDFQYFLNILKVSKESFESDEDKC